MFYELAMLAINNLGRARARLLMTSGGVLVGTTAVIILIALTIGLQQSAEAGIGSSAALTEIQVYPNFAPNPDGTFPENVPELDVEAVRLLWQIPGVAAVIPMVNLQGGELVAGDYTGYTQILGIDPTLLPYLGVQVTQGQLTLERGQALIGAHAGDYFNDPESSGDTYQPVQVDLFNTPFEVKLYQYTSATPTERRVDIIPAGLLQEGTSSYDYAMLMPLEDVIRLNEWITGQPVDAKNFRYDQILVRATDREVTLDVSAAIRDLGFGAGGMGDFLNQLNSFFGTMRLMLGGVGGVALLVAAFGVANTMTMAILERTREIGLMKAIGASDRDILTVFLIEAGLVGLAGGLAGVGLSMLLRDAINQAVMNMPAESAASGFLFLPIAPGQVSGGLIIIPPELSVFALVLATVVGLGAGLYPSLRAARLPPVVALKME
ncbi:MAG: ABC transporter permease [Chloroflexi bacterium]|nr:ABC transporter permease [Chloroflexota bacterium]